MSPACATHAMGHENQVCRGWAERPTEGDATVRQRRNGIRIRSKIVAGTAVVNSPQEFHHPHGQKPQTDDRVDLEKSPIHPA